MPEPGKIGKKPSGSFVNTGEMVGEIKKKKEMDAIQQMQDRGDQDRADVEEQKQDDEIAELLPNRVETAFGEIPYTTFKELYKDVYEAVANKDHWALGYVSHEFEVYEGAAVRVRTMRKREADVLRGVAPKGATFPGATIDTFNVESSEYEVVRLLICLQQFDQNIYTDDVKVNLSNYDEWRKSASVVGRAEQLDNLPDEVIAFLGAVINDTMFAYRCAMTENLKNQLAPLSAITASD